MRLADGRLLADRIVRAETPWRRLVGLLDRRALHAGEGLWLVPGGAVHTWGMRFPLDVLFLDAAGEVVAVRAGLGPWRVAAAPAGTHSVLELPAGAAAGVRLGDRLALTPAEDADA